MTRRRRRPLKRGRGRALDVVNTSVSFGALQALNSVKLSIAEGAFIGLIGPNGAGKTTLFNVISGFVSPSVGHIRFSGRRISHWPPARRAREGIARTFQNVGLHKRATVHDNLLLAREGGTLASELGALLGRSQRHDHGLERRVDELVDRLDLTDVMEERVDQLPIGTAKLVEFLCALASEPRLLLLDEPSSGLSVPERARLGDLLRDIHQTERMSILMIEHDMQLAMGTAEYLYVLNFGTVLAEGTPEQVRRDERVLEAYLGKADTQ